MEENDDETPGARIRRIRLQKGMTQAGLAEITGLSERTIANFESDATFRMDTAHAIAQALGVKTVWFRAPGRGLGPASQREILRARAVDSFRSVLLTDWEPIDQPARDLSFIKSDLAVFGDAYRAKRMEEMSGLGLSLLRAAHTLNISEDTAAVISAVYGLCGRYLTLSHAFDLALVAYRRGQLIAQDFELTALSAVALDGMLWAHLRLGDLDKVESIAAEAADAAEPASLSNAEPAAIARWGWALRQAAAAAARNNRPQEADEYTDAMKRAASELKTVFRTSVIPFGIHTVVTTDTENALLAGRPDAALEAARQEVPAGHRVPNQLRHRLDVAMAHAELGQSDEARTV